MAYRGWRHAVKHHRRAVVQHRFNARAAMILLTRLYDLEGIVDNLMYSGKWTAEEIEHAADHMMTTLRAYNIVIIHDQLDDAIINDVVEHATLPAKMRLYPYDRAHGINHSIRQNIDDINKFAEALGITARCRLEVPE